MTRRGPVWVLVSPELIDAMSMDKWTVPVQLMLTSLRSGVVVPDLSTEMIMRVPPATWEAEMAEKTSGDKDDKAPNTGAGTDQKRDDKATADGKPVDPNRPHAGYVG